MSALIHTQAEVWLRTKETNTNNQINPDRRIVLTWVSPLQTLLVFQIICRQRKKKKHRTLIHGPVADTVKRKYITWMHFTHELLDCDCNCCV